MRCSLAAAAGGRWHQSRSIRAVEHHAVHEIHHVERCSVHRLVGAQPECPGHRHIGQADRGDDRVLAGHVVGGCQNGPGRWPAENEPGTVTVGDGIGQVRTATGDDRELERRASHPLMFSASQFDTGPWSIPSVTGDEPNRPGWIQPGRPTPETLLQFTEATLTTLPVLGAWTI